MFIHLSPVAPLAPIIGEGTLVAFDVGHDGVAYFVVALEPLDYQVKGAIGIFPKTVPEKPQRYRVVGLRGPQTIFDVVITEERFNIHHIQPLSEGVLLVCARSHYNGRDGVEKNGRVYTQSGQFTREILLGDGIASVQVTSKGVIWTSYFDEGVYGNYGWNNPIGASGLVAWDAAGNKLYEFQSPIGLDPISDCYALNVSSDEDVWLYYYTGFPLVYLRQRKVVSVWDMPVSGSDAFAVFHGHALFRGGYKHHDTYRLFALGKTKIPKLLAEIELQNEQGDRLGLMADQVAGRGDTLHLLSGGFLYRVDVWTALATAKLA